MPLEWKCLCWNHGRSIPTKWRYLPRGSHRPHKHFPAEYLAHRRNDDFVRPFYQNEVETLNTRAKPTKTPGLDSINSRCGKAAPAVLILYLVAILSLDFRLCSFPKLSPRSSWSLTQANISSFPKAIILYPSTNQFQICLGGLFVSWINLTWWGTFSHSSSVSGDTNSLSNSKWRCWTPRLTAATQTYAQLRFSWTSARRSTGSGVMICCTRWHTLRYPGVQYGCWDRTSQSRVELSSDKQIRASWQVLGPVHYQVFKNMPGNNWVSLFLCADDGVVCAGNT